MRHIISKPLTGAAVLGILLEAGCGGTVNLSKPQGSAGSDSLSSGAAGSLTSADAGPLTSAGSGSLSSGGAGSLTSGGSAAMASAGAGPGNSGAGNLAGASTVSGGGSGTVCNDPCGTGDGMTCVARNADRQNCGTCGNVCSAGELCFAGSCVSPPAACGADSMLAAPPPLASGKWPLETAIGDWNGDGMTDFATANSIDGTVSVFLGCGGGSFAPKADYAVAMASDSAPLAGLTSCDLNLDGKPDLVAVGNEGQITVTVLLGTGDGTFFLKGISQLTGRGGTLVCADLSGDGKGDVALPNASSDFISNTLSVLLGVGDGTLETSSNYSSTAYPSMIAVGDVNEDGRVDLVAGASGGVLPLLGNADGGLTRLPSQPGGLVDMSAIAIADLNGDGHPDLGVGDQEPRGGAKGGLGIMVGHGDGTFEKLVNFLPAIDIHRVATGDVNGDGRPDLVGTASAGVRVLFGTQGGGVALESGLGIAGDYYIAPALGDMDGDGKLDILTSKRSDNQVYLLLGNGDGTFHR